MKKNTVTGLKSNKKKNRYVHERQHIELTRQKLPAAENRVL